MTEFRDAEYITTVDGIKQIRVKIDGVESWVMMDLFQIDIMQK